MKAENGLDNLNNSKNKNANIDLILPCRINSPKLRNGPMNPSVNNGIILNLDTPSELILKIQFSNIKKNIE